MDRNEELQRLRSNIKGLSKMNGSKSSSTLKSRKPSNPRHETSMNSIKRSNEFTFQPKSSKKSLKSSKFGLSKQAYIPTEESMNMAEESKGKILVENSMETYESRAEDSKFSNADPTDSFSNPTEEQDSVQKNSFYQHKVKSKGMFEELENMVENLGYSFKDSKGKEDTKIVEYDATESQFSQNNNESHALISKCEYLESLNANLVEENRRLKKQIESHSKRPRHTGVEHTVHQESASQNSHIKKIKKDFEKLLEQ